MTEEEKAAALEAAQHADDGDTSGKKDKGSVPYERFEEVVKQNQEYRKTVANEIAELKKAMAQNHQQAERKGKGVWDERIAKAESWDEFVDSIQRETIARLHSEQDAVTKQAEEKLDQEIKGLYDSKLVATDEDVNAVIKFAVDRQKEIGKEVPLHVAALWLKEIKPNDNTKKEAIKKIATSNRGSGVEDNKTTYQVKRKESLDAMIQRLKANAPKV